MGQGSSSSSNSHTSSNNPEISNRTRRRVDFDSSCCSNMNTTHGHGTKRTRGGGGGGEGQHQHRNRDLTLELPDECLSSVFKTLGCQDRNSCSLVCRRWCLIDSKSRNRLLLVAPSEISPLLTSLLSRFSSVTVLSLKCSRKLVSIDDHSLSLIPTLLPSIKKLKLKGCTQISDEGLLAFSLHRPPLLTKLSFASCGFGSQGLISILSNCPSLQDLTLKRLRKLDAQNTPLCLNPSSSSSLGFLLNDGNHYRLQRLCLKDIHNARIFIPLLCYISKTLKTLVVCRSSGNWDQVFEVLQEQHDYDNLCEVQMENVQIGDAGLLAIASCCPDLQVFYLSRTSDCTDDGLSAIANSCRKLRKLHIDVWNRFGSRAIGDEGVLSIASRCSELQEVVLMGIPLTIASLNTFASNCSNLERVALCNTDSIGDSELSLIAAKFSALKKLCIKNCPVSNSGIEAIGEGCPNLVKLKVKRCRGITQASVSRLRRQRSELVVSVDATGPMLEGEGVTVAENGIVTTHGHSTMPNTSTRTHVVCGSMTASLLGCKFGNALQLNRRQHNGTSQSRITASVRAAENSQARR